MNTNENTNPLTDDDRLDTYLRAVWDQFSADLDYRYGRLPKAASIARKMSILGLDHMTPEYVEARLATLKASIARAERDSNP